MIMNLSTSDVVTIPDLMGVPKEGQAIGTWREVLCELAGRICYDSLGKGRPSSSKWHQNIHAVQHYSIHEHATFTMLFPHDPSFPMYQVLFNRPGIWVNPCKAGLRVTVNPRVINDWHKHGIPHMDPVLTGMVWETLAWHLQELAPMMLDPKIKVHPANTMDAEHVQAEGEHEVHATVFMKGSRGFSHEQVRHKHRTAVSQRSTRYVDESQSEWHWHPLLLKMIDDRGGESFTSEQVGSLQKLCQDSQDIAEQTYREIVRMLEPYIARAVGCDAKTARKQARGAARGFLGNALSTEMLFTAPISQWRWMYTMRLSRHADAEIREVFGTLLEQFWEKGVFNEIDTVSAPDGLGICLEE